jgi:uncharacterized protein (DUF433 family)
MTIQRNFRVDPRYFVAMEQQDSHPNIVVHRHIRFGKPRIKGTRIIVSDVLH